MTKAARLFPSAALAVLMTHAAAPAHAAEALAAAEALLPTEAAIPMAATPVNPNYLLPAQPAGYGFVPMHRSVEEIAAQEPAENPEERSNRAWHKRWMLSLAPLVASQSLDAASSWGLRELNPILAGPDGRFGMKATTIKFGAVGGFVGVEYLLVKTFPRSAKFFTVVNYSAAGITTGLAVHNYMLPGR